MKTFRQFHEKATSVDQQRLFGIAYAVKTGRRGRDEVSSDVLKIVDTMTKDEIKKYASTKHSDMPETMSETNNELKD